MSLLVWMPLISDYRSNGVGGNINFTQTGTVTTVPGKIGYCKQFNSSNVIGNFSFTLGSEASLCMWVNHTELPGTSSNNWLFDIASTSGYDNSVIGLSIRYRDKFCVCVGGKYDQSVSHNMVINKWYHVAFVYKDPIVKLYVNGQLIHTYTNLSGGTKKTGTKISLGSNVVNSSTKLKGKLNDVRFYDHAISDKEVYEISKGLVCHYPMHGYSLIDKSSLTTGSYINSSGSITSTSNWFATDYIPVYVGHTYRTSKLSSGGQNTYIGIYNASKVKTRTLLMTANEDNTFTIQSGECYVRLSIRNIANELANAAFYDTYDLIKDCSGLEYDGNIVGNLTVEQTSNRSPRYENNLYKLTGGNYISVPIDAMTSLSDCSVSFWFYLPEWKTNYETLFQAGLNSVSWYEYIFGLLRVSSGANICFTISDGTNSSGHYTASSCSTGTIELNKWNNVTMVYTEGNMKIYINGELSKSYNTSIVPNFSAITKIRIGLGNNGGYDSEAGFSDFRIYSTALSEEDVSSLYRVGQSIDNFGNAWANELHEVDYSAMSFSLNGSIEASTINENTDRSNASIVGYEIHANDFIEA